MRTIGSDEAKIQLPRLLDEVAGGETITITKRGMPVAMLVPASPMRSMDVRAAIEAIRAFRQGKTLGGLSARELVEEGRRGAAAHVGVPLLS